MTDTFELPPEALTCHCDPKTFGFKDTSELKPLDQVIGQKRAVQAIDFGLNMHSPGYNLFITGVEGTGRSTIIKDIVKQFARQRPLPSDWCMVNNFKDPYRPIALNVPTGKALLFSKSMHRFIEGLKIRIPKEFKDKSYQEKLAQTQRPFEEQKKAIMEKLNQTALEKGLMVARTSSGYQGIPVGKDSQPMAQEVFDQLPASEKEEIQARMKALKGDITGALKQIKKISQAHYKALEQLMQEVAGFIIKSRLDILRETYHDSPDILAYLDEIHTDIMENIEQFLGPMEGNSENGPKAAAESVKPALDRYQVNVLVDRKGQKGAPVIYEPNPTYQNVFGRIEKRAHMGAVLTDFTMVQAGSLLHANGGYLIMEIESILMNPGVWEALKRALQNKQLFIEDLGVGMGMAVASLRPSPIPLEVKVILLGGYETFHLLQNHDAKFNKLFKVRADFDNQTRRTDDAIQLYARFIARVCREESLAPFTPEGVAAVVEHGEKVIADKNKLSLRFGSIVGILKEADYWAGQQGATAVTDDHVAKALAEYHFRYNLYEERVHESYVDETIMIDVDGEVVGQVNALAVYQMGDIAFGRPSRITAETYMGKHGIINIEREANLSGSTHDKGVLILSGYLGRTFAQKYPLSLSTSIAFEQSYAGIDGDSASSTELYAILSSLSDVPIHQGFAVTGSVNQKGRIQAIGGVNQKVEGFYDVCKAKGLTGRQGVLIPKSNVKNLMLKKEVIDAVAAGKFHVYQVADVREGIEILTGTPAGDPDDQGDYPKESIYGKVQKKLRFYLEQSLKLRQKFENSQGE